MPWIVHAAADRGAARHGPGLLCPTLGRQTAGQELCARWLPGTLVLAQLPRSCMSCSMHWEVGARLVSAATMLTRLSWARS